MNPAAALSAAHLRTYEAIFQHPAPANLHWHDVRTLLGELGQVTMERNGHLKVTRNGHTLVLAPPQAKDTAQADGFREIRRFLEQSEQVLQGVEKTPEPWLVVINHLQARIFRSGEPDAAPQLILAREPEENGHQGHAARKFPSGKEKSDSNRFFEPIAKALNGAGQILLLGAGTGASSEMERFAAWVEHHRPELARQIIGTAVIDESHLTEPQLRAKAREFRAKSRTI